MEDGIYIKRGDTVIEKKEIIQSYLAELGIEVVSQDETTFVCRDEDEGINNLVIHLADPILVLEQQIAPESRLKPGYERELLKRNNRLIHGAFILDGKENICWKDTLRLENLDLNELEGSIKALSVCIAENAEYFLSNRVAS